MTHNGYFYAAGAFFLAALCFAFSRHPGLAVIDGALASITFVLGLRDRAARNAPP